MIRVVVVDDSALARKLVTKMLESDPKIKVVGTAMNGIFALRRIYRDKPDVVTMDFEMPQMDGLETLETLMERHPVPVVMLSAHTQDGAALTMKALELGAVDFVSKPNGRESEVLVRLRKELVAKVKAAARAKLHKATADPVTQEPAPAKVVAAPAPVKTKMPGAVSSRSAQALPALNSKIRLIAIGSSTGGVPGVSDILSALPANAPPTLVVQHMPATFTASFATRLDGMCRVTVKEAEGGETLEPGLALVARGGTHLGVRRVGTTLVAEVSDVAKMNGHKPSVGFLFESCVRAVGEGCVGVILTGMGKDGGRELLDIRQAGGRTIAESEKSCVIYGMPKEAINLGAAEFILGTDAIPSTVIGLLAGAMKPVPNGRV